jgi:putative phosphoesterase
VVIGVVSDTHLPRFGKHLPQSLVNGLRKAKVETILHAGDLTERFALELFEEIAPVIAVAGNNDGKNLHAELGERRIVEVDGVRIGLVHGHQGRGRTTPDRAFNAFSDEQVDAIVFGHSHIPLRLCRDGVLLFNPGSPTDKRLNPCYSYGILRVEGERVKATHRFYLSRS